MSENRGPIAAVGRACFRRRWLVLAVWLALAVAGFMASGRVFNGLSSESGANQLESVQADTMLQNQSKVGDQIIGEVTGADPTLSGTRSAVTAAGSELAAVPGVHDVDTPFSVPPPASAALIAKDGSGFLIQITLNDLSDSAEKTAIAAVQHRFDTLQAALRSDGAPHATIARGGGALIGQQVNEQVGHDLSLAEGLSLPITLVALIVIFGGLVAAGLPIIAAVLSVFGAMLALLGFEHVTKLDQNATIVVTLLGLGLSIDYGLLLVARYREELAGGYEGIDAVGRAWASAGRTILFSALTVAGSLAGLTVFGVTSMTALGTAGVSIAAIAMLVSLTATAAMLRLARRRIKPARRRRKARNDDRGLFAGLARGVQRRPVVTVLGTAAALLAMGLPMLTTKASVNSFTALPRSLSSVRVADDLSARYGQGVQPAATVVARMSAADLGMWAQQWSGRAGVARVAQPVQVAPDLSTVDVYVTGDPEGSTARQLVHALREHRPSAQSWVGGDAALLDDVLGLIGDRLPWAVLVTVVAMFVLLFLMTGSIVVPLKAIVMNLLSLAATVGVMNLVFQHGFGSSMLHTLHTGSLDPFVMVGVLAFAFGLSMDYEVFLLSRIKEYVDAGVPSDVAVRRGLQRSGRVITSAALCMVIVFACFLVGRVGNTQQIGLGLAAAIAIDATLVRCVLVPATMTLLGRWNWWAPAPLARLHRRWVVPAVAEPATPPMHEPAPVG